MPGDQCTPCKCQSLKTAVREGRLKSVRAIISSRCSHCPQGWKDTPGGYALLCSAVQKKHTEIAKLLIRSGFQVNSRHDSPCNTPLHFAVLNGDAEFVHMLLHRGANINAKNAYGTTPLHNAVESLKMEIILKLLKHRANVNAVDKSGVTPLHLAIKNNSKEITTYLLNSGANVNGKGNNAITSDRIAADTGKACTPLHLAVEKGNEELTKLLLRHSANVDAKVNNGKTLLHLATQLGYLNIVEHLLIYGADVNSMYTSANGGGGTPLHLAADNGHKEIIKLLLWHGAVVNARDRCRGLTALSCAIERGDIDVVELLLKNGASEPAAINSDFKSPLEIAARFGRRKIAELLLEFGAKVNSTITHGIGTPLHAAAVSGQLEMVKLLLKAGASVHSTDEFGETAFQYACVAGDEQIVTALLEHGADVTLVYASAARLGCTPLHVAVAEGHKEIVKLLLSRDVGVNARDSCRGWTALYYAIVNGDVEVVELLLKCGANQYVSTKSDFISPLHKAVQLGRITIVELLLKFGADVNCTDEVGDTPFCYACNVGHDRIVTPLLEHGVDMTIENNYEQFHISLDGITAFSDEVYSFNCECHNCDGHYISTYLNIADILKRHMVKIKVASLYGINESVQSIISSVDEEQSYDFPNESVEEIVRVYCSKKARKARRLTRRVLQKECEEEIAIMKSEKVVNADITFYDILTKDISELTIYARNENIVKAIRSDDYRKKFPIYAGMINSNFRKAEKTKEFLEFQAEKMFLFLYNNIFLSK